MGNGGEPVVGARMSTSYGNPMKSMVYFNFSQENIDFKAPCYEHREGVVGGRGEQLYWEDPSPRSRNSVAGNGACKLLKKTRMTNVAPATFTAPVVAVSHSMVGGCGGVGGLGEVEEGEGEECGLSRGRKRTAASQQSSSSADCVAMNGNAAVSERQRRKVMGDSLVALLSLLPNAQRTRKMDKCTILGKAETYIASLQAQVESLKERKNTLHMIAKQKCKIRENEDVTGNVVQSLIKSPTTTESSQRDLDESTLFNVYVNQFNGTELFITLSAIPEQKNLFTRILSLVENSKIEIVNSTWWQEDGLSHLMLYGKIDRGLHLSIELLKNKFFCAFSSPNSCE